MKKIALIALTGLLFAASCKKDYPANVSKVVGESYPTITFTGQPFYSINTGGGIPSVSATAFDSILKESYPVSLVGTDAVNNTKPGLYIIQAKATNKNGYFTTQTVYVAVTNVPQTTNLAGRYLRVGTTAVANVTKLANGLYSTDNLFGSPTVFATAYFVHVNDTTIIMPNQSTELGALEADMQKLHLAPGDTSYQYRLLTLTTNRAIRTFKKQ